MSKASFRICSVRGCGKKHRAKGFCRTHYMSKTKKGQAAIGKYKDGQKYRESVRRRGRSEKNKAYVKHYQSTNKKFIRWRREYRREYNTSPEQKLKMRIANVRRRLALAFATPKWVNVDSIVEVYANCPEGLVVDHIVPLRGRGVCGLHVSWNLQYLSPEMNGKKSNKMYE